jgi:GNAT superfamily N-acetyltransferase
MEDLTRACEEALRMHWTQLGLLPGGRVNTGDGLVWFETPVRHLPYNGVVMTRLADGAAADKAIASVMAGVRERGADLWWAAHPSATPTDLGERLTNAGLRPVEQMNFMAMDLTTWEPGAPAPPGVEFRIAEDADGIRAYSELTFSYWEIPPDEREAVAELHRAIVPGAFPGHRYIAALDGRPVAKAYLSFAGPPGVAAIYGMSVLPEARGRGVAIGLSAAMMARAKATGHDRAVLHATDIAVGVYERVGFERCGTATVFATADLWSDEH